MTVPDLTPDEAAVVARFDAAPQLPEAWNPTDALQRILAICDNLDAIADGLRANPRQPYNAGRARSYEIAAARIRETIYGTTE